MSLNIGSKVLENGVTVFFKDDFSDCRLYHDLPKGDYVIIDFSSGHNFLNVIIKI